jgi:hypothetical protein
MLHPHKKHFVRTCRHSWLRHVHQVEDCRLPEQLLNYHPKGQPMERLLDDVNAETETGHPGLNS